MRVMIIEESEEQPYAPCALPYWLSGELESYGTVPTREDLLNLGIEFFSPERAIIVDTRNRVVRTESREGQKEHSYDYLVLATGARPVKIRIDTDNTIPVLGLWRPSHAERIRSLLDGQKKTVIVVGAGILGCELAGSLALAGHKVHLVESRGQVMPGLAGPGVARFLTEHLEGLGCSVHCSSRLAQARDGTATIETRTGELRDIRVDLVIVAAGFEPDTSLARASGIRVDKGILVNSRMETSVKSVYACGDCAQVDRIVSRLAPTAMAQAMVVATNILGGNEEWSPGAMPFVARVGKMSVGGAGIIPERTISCTINYKTGRGEGVLDAYASPKGLLRGAFFAAPDAGGDLANLIALVINQGLRLEKIGKLEYAYNPYLTDSIHPLVMAARALSRRIASGAGHAG